MRKFDHEGLIIANFQAKLFEESVKKKKYSSAMFLECFKNSTCAKKLDNKNSAFIDLNRGFFFEEMEEEYGQLKHDECFDSKAMFWLGYITRYICYTRNLSTQFLFEIINPLELLKHYNVYHTQSEEWVINRILDTKGLSESIFNKNQRIKNKLKKIVNNELLNI